RTAREMGVAVWHWPAQSASAEARTTSFPPRHWPTALASATRLATSALFFVALLALPARAQIELPHHDPRNTISVEASRANRWEQGQYDVWWLRGDVTLAQGTQLARGREAILWVDRSQRAADGTQKILAYFEGKVTME